MPVPTMPVVWCHETLKYVGPTWVKSFEYVLPVFVSLGRIVIVPATVARFGPPRHPSCRSRP